MTLRPENCFCYRTWDECPVCVAAREDREEELCEHGMAAWLCAGPMHYPHDDPKWRAI